MSFKQSLLLRMVSVWVTLFTLPLRAQVNVLSYHNDLASTGQNLQETHLTPSNISSATFGKIFSAAVDGQVYGQPLYVPGLPITSGTYQGTTHDTVLVVTMHDSVYAFDATSGVQLWKISTINAAGGETTVPQSDTSSSDISPEIGITSTPAIDPTPNAATGLRYMYLVAKSRLTVSGVNHYYLRLHAIDIASGAERSGSPVLIAETAGNASPYNYVSGPSVAGTGDGAVSGKVTMNALRTHQRCGLTVVNGVVYIASASHGDNGPYHGWVLGYNTSAMQLTAVFNATPNGSEGGIWMGGGIPSSDSAGALYVVTGNGSFANANSNTEPVVKDFDASNFPANHDYGDSVVKLVLDPSSSASSPNSNGWGLKVADYFTPFNQKTLNAGDTDLGSGAPMLLPDSAGSAAHPHLLMCSGKEGRLYLLDRDNLGKFRGGITGGAFAGTGDNAVQVSTPNTITGSFNTPAYFNGAFYYLGAYNNDAGRVFGIANGVYTTAATSKTSDTFGYLSSSPTISASSAATNGVVWCVDRGSNQLRAYAASNLATELYTSAQAGTARDQLGTAVKFGTVTVADGHVFVGTGETAGPSALVSYGLFAPVTTPPAQPANLYAQTVSGGQIDLFWTDNANNESGYEIYVSTDPNNFSATPTATAGAGVTRYSVAGLQVSTTYYFRVRAINAVGASAYSNTAATTSGFAPPVDFTNGFAAATQYLTANGFSGAAIVGSVLRVTDGGANEGHSVWYNTAQSIAKFSTEFTFQFTNASGDGFTFALQRAGLTAVGASGGALGYQNIATSAAIKFDLYPNLSTTGLYYNGVAPNDSTTASATSSGAIDVTSAGISFHNGDILRATLNYDGTTLTEIITDLSTHAVFTHAYTVNLASVLGGSTAYVGFTGGTGGSTAQQDIQSWSYASTVATTPAGPSALSATATSATQFNLAWTDNSSNETGFRVERALGGGTFAPVGSVGANTAVYVDANLITNTAYSYRVVATNAGLDSAPSNVATGTTPVAPVTPSGATPTLVSTTEVDFKWNDNSDNETGFRILRQAGTAGYIVLATLPANTTSYQDTSVLPGTKYSYHIQAFNAAGYVDFTGFEVTTVSPVNIVTSTPTAQENTSLVGAFAVRRSTSPDSPLTVNYTIQTGSGQAAYGSRYTLSPAPATSTSGSVTIPAGATAATITVNPGKDTSVNGAQTVMIVLGAGDGYTVTGGSTASVTLLDTPFNTWRIHEFGGVTAANSPRAADTADPDGDGVTNLMEYALGTDPLNGVGSRLPSSKVELVDGGSYLTLTYVSTSPTPPDVTYIAEASTNLPPVSWQATAAVSGYPVNNADGTVTYKVRTTWKASAYPASFIRLRVTRP